MNKSSYTPDAESKEYFQTKADIWEFLLKGGAITNLDDSCNTYIYLRDGNTEFNSGEGFDSDFKCPNHWRPYPQWKLTKELLSVHENKIKEVCLSNLKVGDFVECHTGSSTLTAMKRYVVVEVKTASGIPKVEDDEWWRIPAWKKNFKKIEGSLDFILNK
jgi:hypothetical protein